MPIVAGATLLIVYLARVDYAALMSHASVFAWQTAVAVVLLNLATGLLKVVRWRFLTGPVNVSLGRRYLAVNAAFFWGLVTPGTAGELTRGLFVGDGSGKLLATLLVEKVTDLGVLCLCVLLAGIAYFASGGVALLLTLPIIVLAVVAARLALRYDRIFTAIPKAVLGLLLTPSQLQGSRDTYRQFHRLARHSRLLLGSAMVSALLWLLPLTQMLVLYRGLGVEASVRTAAIGFFLPYLAGVLSMIPLGIGVFDLGVDRLSVLLGSPAGPISVAPLFFRALVTVPLLLFGYGCHLMLTLHRSSAVQERDTLPDPDDLRRLPH